LSAAKILTVRGSLTTAEGSAGAARKAALTRLATTVAGYKASSSDPDRVQLLVTAIRDLAK
jgi:hypothetical protein